MPAFFGRRYARKLEAVGRTEQALGVVILAAVAAIIAMYVVVASTDRGYLFNVAAPTERADPGQTAGLRSTRPAVGEAPSDEKTQADPFPASDLEGWRAPQLVERFTPDSLYLKIDGRADAFIEAHVVELVFGEYARDGEPTRTLDVYWYDMGTPTNAQAVYRSEAVPDAAAVPVGQGGYQVGGAVFFWAASSYVQVTPSRADGADGQAALRIAQQIAERMNQGAGGGRAGAGP